MQKQRRSSQETTVQMKHGPGSSSKDVHNNISLSSSTGSKIPAQVEDGNLRLSTRFLEHFPVTSPPTNQRKVMHPAALPQNFAYKNSSLKTIREFRLFEHKLPILLAWPFHKTSSVPKKKKKDRARCVLDIDWIEC